MRHQINAEKAVVNGVAGNEVRKTRAVFCGVNREAEIGPVRSRDISCILHDVIAAWNGRPRNGGDVFVIINRGDSERVRVGAFHDGKVICNSPVVIEEPSG